MIHHHARQRPAGVGTRRPRRSETMETESIDQMIKHAVPEGFYGASVLLRFAGDVLDSPKQASETQWVVLRAIDRAEKELRDAVDQGDDMNVVDARMAAIRVRLGITDIRDRVVAGRRFKVEKHLEAAAAACVALWCDVTDA